MKSASLIYALVLTGIDLFLLWSNEIPGVPMLLAFVGVAAISATGLIFPINSFLVKLLVTSFIFGGCAFLSSINLLSGLLFSSLIIHSSALWCEFERAAGDAHWKPHYKFVHRMRHHWLGGLSLYAGMALCYILLRESYFYTSSITVFLLLLLTLVTVLYMEVNRMHNQNAFWVEVSGPLSKSGHYWRTLLIAGTVLGALCWNFSRASVEQVIEWRSLIGEDDKTDDEPDSFQRPPGTRSGFNPGEISLSGKVDITLSDKPELFVTLANPSNLRRFRRMPLYLSAQELVLYDNNVWRPLPTTPTWYKDRDDGKKDGQILLRKRKLGNIKHTVFLLKRGSTALFALTGLHTVELPEVYKSAQGVWGFRDGGDGSLKKYTLESSYNNYDELKGRNLKLGRRKTEYSQLPDTKFMHKMRSLTDLIVKASDTTVEKIDKIRSYLGSECKYSLKVENPDNLMPLDNFIFNEKKGHCVLFASAFTLMLRAAGIPCRVVNGYAGGELDKEKRVFLVRSSNAHAWTEVYFEKYGWVVCDATPQAANIQPGETKVKGFETESFSDVTKDALEAKSAKSGPSIFSNRKKVLIFLIAVLVLLSFFWQYIKKIPSLNFFAKEKKAPIQKRPAFIQAFVEYCQLNQVDCRNSSTIRELLAELLKKSSVEQEILDMVKYYYDVSFSGFEREENRERSWRSFIEKKCRSIK